MRTPPAQAASRRSPWLFGGLTVRQFALNVWQGINDDDVFGRAGQLAYFFFFAIFPLGIFLTSLLGVLAGPDSPATKHLAEYITRAMPASAAGLVEKTVHSALITGGAGKLTFGIFIALLSASSGMAALMSTLNGVFAVRESRSVLKQRTIALALTIALGLLVCVAILLIVAGDHVAHALLGHTLLNSTLQRLWPIAQLLLAIFSLLLAYSCVYYLAPDLEYPQWHWITPGAVVGVGLWIAVSYALRLYLHFFDTFSATYGALGAVMVLLLWFYMTGIAMLIGGEINAVIERAANLQSKQPQVTRFQGAA